MESINKSLLSLLGRKVYFTAATVRNPRKYVTPDTDYEVIEIYHDCLPLIMCDFADEIGIIVEGFEPIEGYGCNHLNLDDTWKLRPLVEVSSDDAKQP